MNSLHSKGKKVEVFLTAKPADLKGDAKINYKAAKAFGVKIRPIKYFLHRQSSTCLPIGKVDNRQCLIVDALLGTGLSKEVRKPLSQVIQKVNSMKCPVISVDIPSGISSDKGQLMGSAVKANQTVTFGLPKRGHLLYPGAEHTGKLTVADIGFPAKLIESERIRVNLVLKEDASLLLPSRPKYSHKGTYGHVLLVAGSRGKTGAALMAARACMRTGAGLVTIGIPETLVRAFQSRITEEMILPLPDMGNGTLSSQSSKDILSFLKKRASVLAVGPGISHDKEIEDLLKTLVLSSTAPMVIDADGLNALAPNIRSVRSARAPVILTPHPGEMARLLKDSGYKIQVTIKEIERNRIDDAVSLAKKTKTCLVLKGVPTVTATPSGNAFLNSTGNPGMASAGTGDVLTGMIAAFLSQGLSTADAAILGVYMHGLTGDFAAEKKGKHSLIASDIIRSIPSVFKSLESC
jgi:NAD(P)H-hydrate epimerase